MKIPIIYLICLAITAVLGAKASGMCEDSRYDRPVTWGRFFLSIIIGLIPVLNLFSTLFIMFCFGDRFMRTFRVPAFFSKPIFPKKKKR